VVIGGAIANHGSTCHYSLVGLNAFELNQLNEYDQQN
jgi:hypothetical protein